MNIKIVCNLYSQWLAGIRRDMSNAGFNHSELSDQDCAIRWQAWRRRIVPSGKRGILKANGFSCPTNLQKGLKDLEQAIIDGSEIWPWQSKFIDYPTFEDGLYNDYGVVHFHIGVGIESNGYINRKRELLFSIVDSKTVHEIGIFNHGEWYELDILDIIDENWPHLLDFVTIPANDISSCIKTREEVKKLREANINPIMKLKSSRIIAPPGGGMAMNGKSIEAIHSAILWTKLLRNGEELIVASIREQVQERLMEEKNYVVHLYATVDEISGVTEDGHKWVLWKRT